MKKKLNNRNEVIFCLFPPAVLRTCLIMCLMFSVFTAYGQMAEGREKYVGNIWYNGTEPMMFSTYWNQLTPENAGKWGVVERTRGQMDWSQLDAMYNYAKSHGYPFKEHCFVWGSQEPDWVKSLPADQQREEVEEWIRLYGERYPDTDSIDVVNEMFHVTPSYANAIGGSGATGWDWVVWSFEKARQYCPNAELLINEYNVIEGWTPVQDYVNLVNILKDRGLIDGIGVQNHGLESTNLNDVRSRITQLGNTGLPIYVSEFDLDFGNDEIAQRNRYAELFPLFYEHPAVAGITLWGYIEGHHWRSDAYILRADGSERPALTWLKEYLGTAPTSVPVNTLVPTTAPTPVPPQQDPIFTGGPYTLNGSSDYVDLPDGLTNDLNDFSIACRVNLNSLDTWSRIYDFGGDTNIFMMLTPASGNTGNPYFCITLNGNDGEQGLNGTGALPAGSWQHIAVTKSGSTGILYINGEEVDRNTNMTINPADMGNTLNNYIGRSQWEQDPYLSGEVDDFFVYNRALSTSEVEALSNTQPNTTPEPTPAGTIGDVDGDDDIDIIDALLIAQYYVELDPAGFIPGNGDTDCDGDIDIIDALLVAQYYVDLISEFC